MAPTGRGERGTVRRRGEPAATPASDGVTLLRTHGAIRTLTGRILSITQRTGKLDVDARVEIGGLLAEVQGQLDYGQWSRWLDESVPFTKRSARSYLRLREWVAEHPGLYVRLAPLGPSKLYLLTALDGQTMRALLRRKKHPIGDSGKSTSLELMTVRELMTVLAGLTGALEDGVAGELVRYRRRVRGLLTATAALAEHAGEIEGEAVEEIYATLLEAVEQLAAMFELEE